MITALFNAKDKPHYFSFRQHFCLLLLQSDSLRVYNNTIKQKCPLFYSCCNFVYTISICSCLLRASYLLMKKIEMQLKCIKVFYLDKRVVNDRLSPCRTYVGTQFILMMCRRVRVRVDANIIISTRFSLKILHHM